MDINNAMYIKIKFLNNQNYYFEGAITFIKFNVFVQKKITSYNNIVGNQILNYFIFYFKILVYLNFQGPFELL